VQEERAKAQTRSKEAEVDYLPWKERERKMSTEAFCVGRGTFFLKLETGKRLFYAMSAWKKLIFT